MEFVSKILHEDEGGITCLVLPSKVRRIGDFSLTLANPRVNFRLAITIAQSLLDYGYAPTKPLEIAKIDAEDKDACLLSGVDDSYFPIFALVDGETRLRALLMAAYVLEYRERGTVDGIYMEHSSHSSTEQILIEIFGIMDTYWESFVSNMSKYDRYFSVVAVVMPLASGIESARRMLEANKCSPFSPDEIRDILLKMLYVIPSLTNEEPPSYPEIAVMLGCSVTKVNTYRLMAKGLNGLNHLGISEDLLVEIHKYLTEQYGASYYDYDDAIAARNLMATLATQVPDSIDAQRLFNYLITDSKINIHLISEEMVEKYKDLLPGDFFSIRKQAASVTKQPVEPDDYEESEVTMVARPTMVTNVPEEISDFLDKPLSLQTYDSVDELKKDERINLSIEKRKFEEEFTEGRFPETIASDVNRGSIDSEARWKLLTEAKNSSHFLEIVEDDIHIMIDALHEWATVFGINPRPYNDNSVASTRGDNVIYGEELQMIMQGTAFISKDLLKAVGLHKRFKEKYGDLDPNATLEAVSCIANALLINICSSLITLMELHPRYFVTIYPRNVFSLYWDYIHGDYIFPKFKE